MQTRPFAKDAEPVDKNVVRTGNDPQPGQRVAVVVQGRGRQGPQPRGEIVIEDLRDVVTRTSFRFGANGPQGAVTQYILAKAVEHLDTQLTSDVLPRGEREPVPRLLSALLGHESFVVNVLGLSPHNMRRRWPLATDWYADLVSYLLRPSRFDANGAMAGAEFPQWLQTDCQSFVAAFVGHQVEACRSPHYFRLADLLHTMWPEYPPVRRARELERSWIVARWVSSYPLICEYYGLRFRADVDVVSFALAIAALVENEAARGSPPAESGWRPDPASDHLAFGGALLMLAGATENLDGSRSTISELRHRRPIGDLQALLGRLAELLPAPPTE